MKLRQIMFFLIALLLWLGGPGTAGAKDIFIINVSGSINPGVADYIESSIQAANENSGLCIIITLDTPGGLADAMRKIVKAIYASRIPVVVYVSPSGARAASAGVMITMAADIAAMAPGTNIGAASPVGMGGGKMDETTKNKVMNDMVAYVKSIANRNNRNAKWAEQAVREAVSVTESEALKENIIDLVASDMADLIKQIDGRKVESKGVLELKGAQQTVMRENLRTKILKTISNPNIAYILLLMGLAGIYFELSNPGAVFPGVIGGISLILAFFAMQTLPINYAGILLIILALILFIMEIKITSYGLLSVAGTTALLLGSLMLFDGDGPETKLSWQVFLPTFILISGFFIVVASIAFKSQVMKPRTGAQGLIGKVGIVKQPIAPEGKVMVHGELWKATAKDPIQADTKVRVVKIEGLVLEVEALS
ncbi:MAG: nodulation protein NfeD [Desulfobacterales bacterium]|nr:nodulation protein NfeD [Desulfobacterales bacterium]